jgi:hypothetical protein
VNAVADPGAKRTAVAWLAPDAIKHEHGCDTRPDGRRVITLIARFQGRAAAPVATAALFIIAIGTWHASGSRCAAGSVRRRHAGNAGQILCYSG